MRPRRIPAGSSSRVRLARLLSRRRRRGDRLSGHGPPVRRGRLENRRRLVELSRRARSDAAADSPRPPSAACSPPPPSPDDSGVRVLTAHAHFDERLNLRLDAIELDRHELRVLHALVVVEPQLGVGDAVLQRVASCARRRRPAPRRAAPRRPRAGRQLLLTRAAEEAIESRLRHQQLEEEKEQPIERRRADRLGRVARAGRLPANARRDVAHLEAALAQRDETAAATAAGSDSSMRCKRLLRRRIDARRRTLALARLRGDRARRSPCGTAASASRPVRYASSSPPTIGSNASGCGDSAASAAAADEEQQIPGIEERVLDVGAELGADGR